MVRPAIGGVRDVVRGFPRPSPGRRDDPGLFGPGSMVWRLNGEAITILGGGRALLMQIAHPMVAAGVADHSDFGADPYTRLWRTLDAVLTVAFGDGEHARAAAERVTDLHRRVVGSREGRAYQGLDPDLLLWVHATIVDTALVTYGRFVRPLVPSERERYHQEMKSFAAAFDLPEPAIPRTVDDLERYVAASIDGLIVTDEARRLARGILSPPAPVALWPLRAIMREATVGLLPPRLRAGFGLRWDRDRDRILGGAAAACRLALPLMPARLRYWPHAIEARARVRADAGE